MALLGSASAWQRGALKSPEVAGRTGGEAGGGSGPEPSGREREMVLPGPLLGSARRAIFGSAQSVLWGELCGPWGKGQRLTSGPGGGMALVGVLAS